MGLESTGTGLSSQSGENIEADFVSLSARAQAYVQSIVSTGAPLTLKPPTVNDFALTVQTNAGQVEPIVQIEDSSSNVWAWVENERLKFNKGGTSPAMLQFANVADAGTIGCNIGQIYVFVLDSFSVYRDFVGEVFRVDGGGVADDIRMFVWDVSAGSLKRVSRGAADSGGAGFRLLRVAN